MSRVPKKNKLLNVFLLAAFCVPAARAVYSASTDTVMLDSGNKKSPVTIKATIDKPKITIGDKLTYSVSITHDRKLDVKVTDIADTLGQFEIKDYKLAKPARKGRKLVTEYRYVITTFTTGEFSIEPFFVEWVDADGNPKRAGSAAITVFVEGVKASAADKDDIRDVKPPVDLPRPLVFYILLYGLPLAAICGGAFYFLFVKNRGKSGFFSAADENRTPDELAYERLQKLESMGLVEKGEIKEYYIILSEIIRRYLEARYRISVLDMTTHELYQQMKNISLEKKQLFLVKDFLDECDMVKFAKYRPEIKYIKTNFEAAKNIVDVTREATSQAAVSNGEKTS